MYRIDNVTSVAALPTPAAVGPKPNSYFTKGDPGAGIPATIVDDDWANAVQEELIAVVLAGSLTPSKTVRTQVRDAINALIAANVAPDASTTVKGKIEIATDAEVQAGTDAVRAVTPAGLSSRTATDTRTGVVELATNAEAQTATDATRAVTPANLGATVLGIGQTWQDLTASRALSTNYTNSTGRTIAINIRGSIGANGTATLTVGGVVIASGSNGFGDRSVGYTLTAIVPNGAVYNLVGLSISVWAELRA